MSSEMKSSLPEVILPNMNRRFSGITATVAALLPHQAKDFSIATVGHPLPMDVSRISWTRLVQIGRAARKSGRPIIFHARRNNEMIAGWLLRTFLGCRLHLIFTSTAQRHHSSLTRFLYHRMDTLLSTSPRAASFLRRTPDTIVPHGVDTEIWRPAADRQRAWEDTGLPGKFAVGIFGRVRPSKGVGDFVHALCPVLPDVPECTAVIVGETTPQNTAFVLELQEQIRSMGLENRFEWIGKRPFDEIPGWFRRMSLVVCASHNEGFGLTCLEAMASGVPVVATRTGAWESIIQEGSNGWIVDCADPHQLSAALADALSDPQRLQQMGASARRRVEEDFPIQKEASSLNQIYRTVLKNE